MRREPHKNETLEYPLRTASASEDALGSLKKALRAARRASRPELSHRDTS